jgi:putative oxidoreductase
MAIITKQKVNNMTFIQQHSSFFGRILISLIFLVAGTAAYMQAMGVPSMLLPLVILTEIGGATAIILGYKTRLVAFLLAGFSVLSALLFHLDFSDQTQSIMFMKNIAIAGGFLFLVANGPGKWALDKE